MSYNKLGDSAGRALGKLLNGHSVLRVLDISNNGIGPIGGTSLGHALQVNTTLTHLNLKLNRSIHHYKAHCTILTLCIITD